MASEVRIGHLGVALQDRAGLLLPVPPAPLNLMTGKVWTPDANTTLSIAGGKARATIGGGANPRIWKHITGLVNGATYKLNGRMYLGTCTTVRLRISPNSGLIDGSIYELIDSVDHLFTDVTFVMSGTVAYIGVVGISSATLQYSEIDDNFSLIRVT